MEALRKGVVCGPLKSRAKTIAFIGDSITKMGCGWEKENTASIVGQSWLMVGGSPDVTCQTGSATLEFRAADGAARFTAPSDTAGAWTALVAGYNVIPSGTNSIRLIIGAKMDLLPATDQTISLAMSQAYNRYQSQTYWTWTQQFTKNYFRLVSALGVGGDCSHHVLDRIGQIWEIDAWGNAVTDAPGYVCVLVGTNDVGDGSITSGTILSNIAAIASYIKSRGAVPILCTMTARDSMPAGWFTTMQEVNDGIIELGVSDDSIICVDLFSATVNHLLSAGATVTNYTTDGVHLSNLGGYIAGKEIATVLNYYTGGRNGAASSRFAGGQSNKFKNGQFINVGGSKGAGITGDVAQYYSGSHTGAGLTAVASLVSSVGDSNWQRYVCTGASLNESLVHQLLSTNVDTYGTLAAMGLVAGDRIYAEVEYSASSAAVVRDITLSLGMANPTTYTYFAYAGYDVSIYKQSLPDAAFSGKIMTPVITIPSDVAKIRLLASVGFGAAGSVTIDFRNMGIYKVA